LRAALHMLQVRRASPFSQLISNGGGCASHQPAELLFTTSDLTSLREKDGCRRFFWLRLRVVMVLNLFGLGLLERLTGRPAGENGNAPLLRLTGNTGAIANGSGSPLH